MRAEDEQTVRQPAQAADAGGMGEGDEETVIHRNEVKEQHTTHWDLDVLTDEELDQIYARERAQVQRRQRLQRLGRRVGVMACATLLLVGAIWMLS